MTCYPSCFVHLEYLILSYEGHDQINSKMVIIWCYMSQMNVNEQITWWNKCVQHVIQVG